MLYNVQLDSHMTSKSQAIYIYLAEPEKVIIHMYYRLSAIFENYIFVGL